MMQKNRNREKESRRERERARDSRETKTDINTTIPDIQKLVVNYPQ